MGGLTLDFIPAFWPGCFLPFHLAGLLEWPSPADICHGLFACSSPVGSDGNTGRLLYSRRLFRLNAATRLNTTRSRATVLTLLPCLGNSNALVGIANFNICPLLE